VFVFLHNPQSLGNIALASAAADSAPLIDPKFFTHAFDRAVAIAATRRALDFINNPLISANIESPVNVPASGSDDDVLEFWRKSANSTWHPSCTVRMGRDEDEKACVQSDFKVKRLQSLRVVDLSVLPFLLNCHPMSVAYLVGEIAAEKIIREHGLDVCDT
jgi:choline dehydrogenase-like flavoprotein